MLAPEHFSKQNPMMPIPYHVQEKIIENGDTVTLKIQPCSPADTCTIAPGQFNMLYLFGIGEIPISVSKVSEDDATLWHTIRSVGTVSKGFLTLQPGDMIGLRGGFGIGWPMAQCIGRDVLLIAGGIGLAPLRPTIHTLLKHRERYGQVTVVYGARSPEDQIFLDEIAQWSNASNIRFLSTVDHANTQWHGNVGVVTHLLAQHSCTPEKTIAMICGPEIMMHFSILALERLGITSEQIFVSMERNMKCAVGHCGHCQWGGDFMCKDGPVFAFSNIASRFRISGF